MMKSKGKSSLHARTFNRVGLLKRRKCLDKPLFFRQRATIRRSVLMSRWPWLTFELYNIALTTQGAPSDLHSRAPRAWVACAVNWKRDWNWARSKSNLEMESEDALDCTTLPMKPGAGDSA